MLKIKKIIKPMSIEEAIALNSQKTCRILGGGAFLRLSNNLTIDQAIDLEPLGLNQIKDTETAFEIGAMTSLRQLETNQALNSYFDGQIQKSVENIVGVQLRNIATIGGSIYPKYGFSDLITMLLVLDTQVEFAASKTISLEIYLSETIKRKDILKQVHIHKDERKTSFQMMRNSKSDFAILNVAVSFINNQFKIAVGARPERAVLAEEAMALLNKTSLITDELIHEAAMKASETLSFGNNRLGSAFYRKALCVTLIKRGIMEVYNGN